MGQAATLMSAWAIGAGDWRQLQLAARVSIFIGANGGILTPLLFWFARAPMVGLFLDDALPLNRPAIDAGIAMLGVIAVYQLVDGPQRTINGALRGMKDVRVPMIVLLTGFWIFGAGLALILAFQFDLAGVGVWSGLSASIALSAVILGVRLRWRLRTIHAVGV